MAVKDYSLVIVVGMLTEEPKKTPNGGLLTLSVEAKGTGEPMAIKVAPSPKLADLCYQFLKIGRRVMVVGSLLPGRAGVQADRVQFLAEEI